MVTGAVASNISAEATTPTGNIFAEAMRGSFYINGLFVIIFFTNHQRR
jgi:hypothetical protein